MSDSPARPIRVLFVCLGNICRSPLAEVLFRMHARQGGVAEHFEISSSGTGDWHAGNPADPRTVALAERSGISLADHSARQVTAADLAHYDHILAMDKRNLSDLLALDAQHADDANGPKIRLLREFDEEPGDFSVPDPYYGGEDGFADVQAIVDRSVKRLLDGLTAYYEISPSGA